MRRLEILQWAGLLGGAALWGVGHVVGFGVTEARCSSAGAGWGIDFDLWEGLITGLAWALALGAALASVAVILGTRGSSYESAPPVGRLRFFAIAALAANAIFMVALLLYALGTIFNVACRQA
jgi:hypothetical protein